MTLNTDLAVTGRPDPLLALVAAVGSPGVETRWIAEGVLVSGHFGSSAFAPGYEHYPEGLVDTDDEYGWGFSPYGVCDNHEQVLARCPTLTEPGREFFVKLTPVLRSQQEPVGGWRWHKWGPYIGVQEPTTEYLYDEPLVEQVYCFHIYEKKKGAR